jgi:hypothetical protein
MNLTKESKCESPWLLLVFSLTRKSASLRVTIWRKLQRNGSLPLGNSGYLLPNTAENRERFEWLATMIRDQQGEASIVEVRSIDNCSRPQLIKRFTDARTRDYQDLFKDLRRITRSKNSMFTTMRLRQRFQEIAAIDFFGSPVRKQVEGALNELQNDKAKIDIPDTGKVSPAAYRNRLWVTRPRPGVDRVCSAWLIRRFIDPKAKFVFAVEDQKPSDAVPFDMYQGGFGHRGEDCTFETLLKAFHIRDKKAGAMGQIVHDADLFDEKFGRKEGFGIDEIMKGWARQGLSDQELMDRGMQLAEGIYQSL